MRRNSWDIPEGRIDLLVDEGGETGGGHVFVDQSVVVGGVREEVPRPCRTLQSWSYQFLSTFI